MAKILNNLLCTLMIFALAFLWVYFSIKNVLWALALAAITALSSSYILWRAASKREKIKNAKLRDKKAAESFAEFLRFNADNAELFSDMMRFYGFTVEKYDYDNLVAEKDGEKCFAAICFEADNLSKDRLRHAILNAKRQNADKLYIFAPKADTALQKLSDGHVATTFVDAANAYELFDQCGKLPTFVSKRKTKNSFVAEYAFNKRRFGWYFASSLFMLIISTVSFFPWYTLSWSTVMLGLALYSLLNKRFNPVKTAVTLS
ncbi:MAG: hypothetical protein NC099_04945 [Corallococcus sp.]|nr:hypothetical protein [Corallococcus sp.]